MQLFRYLKRMNVLQVRVNCAATSQKTKSSSICSNEIHHRFSTGSHELFQNWSWRWKQRTNKNSMISRSVFWTCILPCVPVCLLQLQHQFCSARNNPQILHQGQPGTWWWCDQPTKQVKEAQFSGRESNWWVIAQALINSTKAEMRMQACKISASSLQNSNEQLTM